MTPLVPGRARLPDGRALATLEGGAGGPLVVFESGAGICLPVWRPVQRIVAAHTRTLSYDRAGYGTSDDGPRPRTVPALVADLRGLLDAVSPGTPVVLAGVSFAAVLLRALAAVAPDRVAGMVLADPTTSALVPPSMMPFVRTSFALIAGLSRVGAHGPLARAALGPGLAALVPGDGRDGLLAAVAEGRNWRAGNAEVRDADPRMRVLPRLERAGLPDVPVTTVVGSRPDRGERRRRAAQVAFTAAEAARHPHGRAVASPGSSHFVPWQEPELLAREIVDLVHGLR
ncbi:alpha/beta hydrolase [Pseudonocardia petroleophila]|uniref:Alpha/beta hydrolase n=1 Tax=Pseudonocardia petroleophila TaxID=37331 RepID=A0A7G7MAN0_9PSEU|nr:alpha/beta hydrolase [Pseudonocardia petroleophila]QNG49841.1 alpha/beta hydrolase [Pseudonocardia petroleophila]